jgi:hypothetical protein
MNCEAIRALPRAGRENYFKVPKGPGVLLIFDKGGELWCAHPADSMLQEMEDIIASNGHSLLAGFNEYAFQTCITRADADALLETVNVKLGLLASDIGGKTARLILSQVSKGNYVSEELAKLPSRP